MTNLEQLALCALCAGAMTLSTRAVAQGTAGTVTLPPTECAAEAARHAGGDVFATPRPTHGDPQEDGLWLTLEDGTATWSLRYLSSGAQSISLTLAGVELPDGSSLTVSGDEGDLGAAVWTGGDTDTVTTPTVWGDALTLRYTGPETPSPRFHVTSANCGFRDIGHGSGNGNKTATFGSSNSCEVAAACLVEDDRLSRGTCRLILNGMYLGTGTLVNNTAADRAPLVLTSAHVLGRTRLTGCEALFGFEEPLCNNEMGIYNSGTEQISGGTIAALDARTDMAVIRLSRRPSALSRPYWMGWSRTMTAPTSGDVTCVHHPAGDVKKVSVAKTASPSNTYSGDKAVDGGSFTANSHWRVARWDVGTTEGGSSGSALATADGLVIGGLTGGSATCKNPVNDYFWMVGQAWLKSSDGYATLRDALDPNGTDSQETQGLECVMDDGNEAKTCSTFSASDDTAEAGDALDDALRAMAQPLPGTQRRTIWAIRLHSAAISSASSSSTGGASVTAGVTTDPDQQPTASSSALLAKFRSTNVVDFALPSPVTVEAGQRAYIRIDAVNFAADDRLPLLRVAATDNFLLESHNGAAMTAVEGCSLALSAICTGQNGNALTEVEGGAGISISMAGNTLTVCGDALSLVAIYDRGGRLMTTIDAHEEPEVTTDMCGLPSGIYVIRAMARDGRQASLKVINY